MKENHDHGRIQEAAVTREEKPDQTPKPGRWIMWAATAFGAGYSPAAPGTVGTLAAVVLYLGLCRLGAVIYLLIWIALFIAACRIAHLVQTARGEDDPQIVVIDEVAGFLIAMFLLPPTPAYLAAAFFLFRLLDVIKPFPADYFDQEVKNGFGIVMDDVAAGIYTNLLLQAFRWIFR